MSPAEIWRDNEQIAFITKGEIRIVKTNTGQSLRIRGKKYGAGVRIQGEDEDFEDNIPIDQEVDYDDIRVVGR